MTKPDIANRRYLFPRDVAELLGVSPRTVARWCRAGDLSAIRIQKRGGWRIPMAALRAKLALAEGENP